MSNNVPQDRGPENRPLVDAWPPTLSLPHYLRLARREGFAFWMACGYLFVEYVRPQSIIESLDIVPWGKLFVGLGLVGMLSGGGRIPRHSILNWMLVYFLIVLAASATAFSPRVAWEHLVDYYVWLVAFLLIAGTVTNRTRFLILISIFLIASFKISLSLSLNWAGRGFAFTNWGLKGPPGFFENSGELAIQMAVFWPIALAFAGGYRQHVSQSTFRMLLLMPITACVTILGSSSRGGQLALIAQIGFKYWRRVFTIKVLALTAMFVFMGFHLLPDEQKERFESIGEDKTSIQRLLYWKRGLQMLQEHPALGVGLFNFPVYFERHYPDDVLYKSAQLPHNIFIQVGSELGYSGLLAYLIIIFKAFSAALRCSRESLGDPLLNNIARAMNVSLIGFLVAGQFVSVVYYPFLWIHCALLVSLQTCIRNQRG